MLGLNPLSFAGGKMLDQNSLSFVLCPPPPLALRRTEDVESELFFVFPLQDVRCWV